MAGLPTQNIPVPFAQGVTTKIDPKQAPLGKLLTLENGIFQTPLEIRKRYGFTALSQSILGGGTLDSANGQFGFNDELLVSSPSNATVAKGGMLYSYDVGNTKWSSVGPFYSSLLTTQPVSTSETDQYYCDGTYDAASGLRCSAWYNSVNFDVEASIIDVATGKVVFAGAVASAVRANLTLGGIKVIAFNNNFFVIYTATAGGTEVRYSRIATATPTTVASTGTIATASRFDAIAVGSRLFVAYGAGGGISTVYLDTSYVISSATVSTFAGTVQSVGICSDGATNLGVVAGTAATIFGMVFSTSLVTVLAATNLGGAASNINQAAVCYSNSVYHVYGSNNTNSIPMRYARFNTSGAVTGLTNFMQNVCVASRPFAYNGQIFIMVGAVVTYQETLLLVTHYADCDDSYPACVVGKVAYSAYAVLLGNGLVSGQVTELSTGIYQFAYGQQTGIKRTTIASSSNMAPVATWVLTIDLTKSSNSAQIANGLHLSGGQLWLYDGLNIAEHGFHFYPTITGSGTAASGSIANGTYQYVVVYEWIDGQGQLHRSAPSSALSKTLGSTDATITVTARTLSQTNKRGITTTGTVRPTNKVKICFYRTLSLGTIFYFAGSVDNDITASEVTFTDTSADATILLNIQLYTTGGVVENTGAPACLAVATYKSRLIVIPSDNPYSWWFSQEVIPDSEATLSTPAEMSDLLIQNIDQKGGPLTGCISMDDKLILMKRNLPYYVVGNGPGTNGANNDYSPPQEITSPVGSDRANSLVLTPLGVMFQAANSAGIWLLDRGLNCSYVGSDVEAYNSQSVTSAVLYPQYNQIRFTLSGGVCLGFDYFVNQWTVFTNVAAVQAGIWRGTYAYMRSTALALQESTSTFTDNGTFVQLKIGTTWMKFAGLQGFQRIYECLILGDYQTAHTLTAKVYYDFDPVAGQTTTITPTATYPYQWRLQFKRQKCEAMKIEIYDTQVSPAEGMRLSALTLIAGIKYGLNKMSASRTFD